MAIHRFATAKRFITSKNSYMAKSKTKKVEIVSVTYRSNGQEFTATPLEKKLTKKRGFDVATNDDLGECTPGDVRCENGIRLICFNIGGQTDWLTSDERC